MLLTDAEIKTALALAASSFPNLTDWKSHNQKDDAHLGFSLWGRYDLDASDPMSRGFYIAFNTFEKHWYGHLTIGQPSYLWSSADAGDAHLVSTNACESLPSAIDALKAEMGKLFRAFSAV